MEREVEPFEYSNKVILAPMVRVGTLPFRLLTKRYGAQLLYGEEMVDHSVIASKRVVNEALGTIDYIKNDGKTLLYRTCKEDYPNIFQMGTSSSVNALKTAEKVYRDVAALDVNMGCPKHFSIQGGMGAALLEKPETVKDILSTLVRNIDKPVTCKIRLRSELSKTLELMKIAESCGIKAITVHCRYVNEKPIDRAHWDQLKEVIDHRPVAIPIIANGDVLVHEDIQKIKDYTGADSVMIARGACRNPSIFSPNGKPIQEMMKEFLATCLETDNPYSNTKYTLMYMTREQGKWLAKTPEGQAFHKSKNYLDLCKIWNLEAALANSPVMQASSKSNVYLDTAEEPNNLPTPKRVLPEANATIPDLEYHRLEEPSLKKIKSTVDEIEIENSGNG